MITIEAIEFRVVVDEGDGRLEFDLEIDWNDELEDEVDEEADDEWMMKLMMMR